MFKKFLLISLVCIGVVAFAVSQASAGCCCNPRFCAIWLKGSVESYNTAVIRNYAADCTDNCPEILAAAYGVIPPGGVVPDIGFCANFNPDDPYTLDCTIPGLALCNNPANKKPRNFPSGTAVPYNAGSTTSGFVTFICDKNGNCKQLLSLDFPDIVCKDNWNLVDFTAQEFIGVQDMCPGGFDKASPSQCCATNDRDSNGLCVHENPGLVNGGPYGKAGKPTRYVKLCYHDLTNSQFGDSFTYCCGYCDPLTNGRYDCSTASTNIHNGVCID